MNQSSTVGYHKPALNPIENSRNVRWIYHCPIVFLWFSHFSPWFSGVSIHPWGTKAALSADLASSRLRVAAKSHEANVKAGLSPWFLGENPWNFVGNPCSMGNSGKLVCFNGLKGCWLIDIGDNDNGSTVRDTNNIKVVPPKRSLNVVTTWCPQF
jgi:hypothetical protein